VLRWSLVSQFVCSCLRQRNTPLEGIMSDIVSITAADGQRVEYVGAIYHRADPITSEFVALAAGATLTAEVDVASVYPLVHGVAYTIVLDTAVATLPADAAAALLASADASVPLDKLSFAALSSPAVRFVAEHPAQPAPRLLGRPDPADANQNHTLLGGLIGCSSARATIVRAAVARSQQLSSAAAAYFNPLVDDAAYVKVGAWLCSSCILVLQGADRPPFDWHSGSVGTIPAPSGEIFPFVKTSANAATDCRWVLVC
jgi:hypothetical protein